MENVLLVNVTTFAVVVSVLTLYAMRYDEWLSRKWARIRVRIDNNSRQRIPEPQEEEVETHTPLQWLLLCGMFLFLILLANSA